MRLIHLFGIGLFALPVILAKGTAHIFVYVAFEPKDTVTMTGKAVTASYDGRMCLDTTSGKAFDTHALDCGGFPTYYYIGSIGFDPDESELEHVELQMPGHTLAVSKRRSLRARIG